MTTLWREHGDVIKVIDHAARLIADPVIKVIDHAKRVADPVIKVIDHAPPVLHYRSGRSAR
jgi:hypothetical protein